MKQSLTKTIEEILGHGSLCAYPISSKIEPCNCAISDIILAIKERDKEVLGEDKHRVTVMARCSKCRSYGNEGEYCKNDGKMITEKEELQWETIEETAYNRAKKEIKDRQEKTL